jgi:hypothetical protein
MLSLRIAILFNFGNARFPEMKLSPEQHAKLQAFINSKWRHGSCQVCGQNSWGLNDIVFELRAFQGGSLIIGGQSPIYPVCTIACNNCGNTIFINALVAGLDLSTVQPPFKPDAPVPPLPAQPK